MERKLVVGFITGAFLIASSIPPARSQGAPASGAPTPEQKKEAGDQDVDPVVELLRNTSHQLSDALQTFRLEAEARFRKKHNGLEPPPIGPFKVHVRLVEDICPPNVNFDEQVDQEVRAMCDTETLKTRQIIVRGNEARSAKAGGMLRGPIGHIGPVPIPGAGPAAMGAGATISHNAGISAVKRNIFSPGVVAAETAARAAQRQADKAGYEMGRAFKEFWTAFDRLQTTGDGTSVAKTQITNFKKLYEHVDQAGKLRTEGNFKEAVGRLESVATKAEEIAKSVAGTTSPDAVEDAKQIANAANRLAVRAKIAAARVLVEESARNALAAAREAQSFVTAAVATEQATAQAAKQAAAGIEVAGKEGEAAAAASRWAQANESAGRVAGKVYRFTRLNKLVGGSGRVVNGVRFAGYTALAYVGWNKVIQPGIDAWYRAHTPGIDALLPDDMAIWKPDSYSIQTQTAVWAFDKMMVRHHKDDTACHSNDPQDPYCYIVLPVTRDVVDEFVHKHPSEIRKFVPQLQTPTDPPLLEKFYEGIFVIYLRRMGMLDAPLAQGESP